MYEPSKGYLSFDHIMSAKNILHRDILKMYTVINLLACASQFSLEILLRIFLRRFVEANVQVKGSRKMICSKNQ